jgi:uncharacterized protein YraI
MYTQMKRFWFELTLWTLSLTALMAGFAYASPRTVVLAQESTPGSGDVFVTVTNAEQINVRSGPSTVLYDIIGNMQPGETAKALGVSPGRDWVEIEFPAGPGGIGWVYTSLISVSSGNLQIIEPPPTPTPRTTPTIDPTLAAAYIFEPTETRMPTFTPPPPLEIPHFTEAPSINSKSTIPMGALVLGSGIFGLLGYLYSLLRRR